LSLRQLIHVAYQAFCEAVGKPEADEALEKIVVEAEKPGETYVTAAEQQSRQELLRLFGMGGVTSSPV
jgi:hypothetical protein